MPRRTSAYDYAAILSDTASAEKINAIREAFGSLTSDEQAAALWLLRKDREGSAPTVRHHSDGVSNLHRKEHP